MDINFLETFVIVAECGSLAEAARQLNLTPAAVAQRLRSLEKELGHVLVSRSGRTVRPTASGWAVLGHAPSLIEGARDLKAIAANDFPVGELRLGATATALTGMLPEILVRLKALYPGIESYIKPGSSADLYNRVSVGEIDAAIIVQPQFPIPKSMGWLTLRIEPLVLIMPLAMSVQCTDAIIEQTPFIRYDRRQWGGQIVDRYLRQRGLKVQEWLELDALDAIAALVDRGLGVAVVPDWPSPWPQGLQLQKIILPEGEDRLIGIVWARLGRRIHTVNAFIESCNALKEEAK